MSKRFNKYLHALWHALNPEQACGSLDVVTADGVRRQMLYDAFHHAEVIAERMGLPPISEDVADMECKASLARMEVLLPIFPLLMEQGRFLAGVATALQLDQSEDVTEEAADALATVFDSVIKASLVAAVSTAVSMNVLEINKGVTVDD